MGVSIERATWVVACLGFGLGCREARSPPPPAPPSPSVASEPAAAVVPTEPSGPPDEPDVGAPSWTRSLVPIRASDPDALVGRLTHRHSSEIVDFYDEDTREMRTHLERVTDFLRICPDASGALGYDLYVATVNTHTCELRGEVRRDPAGTLVLVLDQREYFVPPPEESERFCYLRLEREGDSIRVAGLWPLECELSTCGARAHPFAVFELRTLDRRDCRRPFRHPSE